MGMSGMFGKFRGVCIDNVDPLGLGRIRVVVPAVLGEEPSAWASACLQPGAVGVPPLDAAVWVEFEGGDSDHPIWVGLQWINPGVPPIVDSLVLEVVDGRLILDERGVILEGRGGSVAVSSSGVRLDSGLGASVVALGPTVDVNAGALTVT